MAVMSTATPLVYNSQSSADTQALGEQLGQNLKGGEVIELTGDVGAGKTELTRGLARGIDSHDQVASPTFTISRVYRSGPKHPPVDIYHFDFYRLTDPGILQAELAEIVQSEDVAVVVEWSDIAKDVLPDDRLQITFASPGHDERKLTLKAGPKHQHLLKGLKT